jgi:hypothetical protein
MALSPTSILVFTGVPGEGAHAEARIMPRRTSCRGAHKELDTDTLMRRCATWSSKNRPFWER